MKKLLLKNLGLSVLTFSLFISFSAKSDTTYSCSDHGKTFEHTLQSDSEHGYDVIDSLCSTMWTTHANKMGFKKKHWDDGWGFNSCGNETPLKRALKSYELLKISKNTSLSNDIILNSMYGLAANWIGTTKPACARNENDGAVGSFSGSTMKLYLVVFSTDLLYLTSTVVHEARHKKKAHNAGNNAGDCSWEGSCDTTYEYGGANAYELAYMWWYGVKSSNSTTFTRQLALDTAQNTNVQAFQYSPNFNIPTNAN